jgi:hypothetical protein
MLEDGASVTAETIRNSNGLFEAEPTGTIEGIVEAGKVPIGNGDPVLKDHVIQALSKMGTADLASKSPHMVFKQNPDISSPRFLQSIEAWSYTPSMLWPGLKPFLEVLRPCKR